MLEYSAQEQYASGLPQDVLILEKEKMTQLCDDLLKLELCYQKVIKLNSDLKTVSDPLYKTRDDFDNLLAADQARLKSISVLKTTVENALVTYFSTVEELEAEKDKGKIQKAQAKKQAKKEKRRDKKRIVKQTKKLSLQLLNTQQENALLQQAIMQPPVYLSLVPVQPIMPILPAPIQPINPGLLLFAPAPTLPQSAPPPMSHPSHRQENK